MLLRKMIFNMKKNNLLIIIFKIFSLSIYSQQIAEGVFAVVGDNIILQSEIEQQYLQLKSSNQSISLKCQVVDDLLFQKLLSHHANVDSLEVTDDEINEAIDQRINYFISQIGSQKKLEDYFDKSISEIRDEFYVVFKEQRLAQRMENKIISNVKVTPKEVLKFYNNIAKDSLPIFAEEIYLSQLVIFPKVGETEKELITNKLMSLKKRIKNGEDFAFLASLYSDDPGSSKVGGDLGFVSKGKLVPEFESVAFRLQEGELSEVVETKYGFHLIQMVERLGQQFNIRHILIKPKISNESIKEAQFKLDSIITLMIRDTLSFEDIAIKYSEDETKNNGGVLVNQKTGSSSFILDELDYSLAISIDGLTEKEYSKPAVFDSPDGRKGCRIIYVDRIIPEHVANLKDDYDRIHSVALQEIKANILNEWKENKIKETYIDFKHDFDCAEIEIWKK